MYYSINICILYNIYIYITHIYKKKTCLYIYTTIYIFNIYIYVYNKHTCIYNIDSTYVFIYIYNVCEYHNMCTI